MASLEKKFARLYDENIEKIFRFVFLKVDSKETAEDISAQVFTKSWKIFQSGTEIKNPSAYFFQLARAAIADHYRQKARFHTLSIEEIEIVGFSADPEESRQLKIDIADLMGHLKKIGDDYQNVLIMRYINNMPIKVIAQSMEKPEGTVRVMIHRGLNQLREIMGAR